MFNLRGSDAFFSADTCVSISVQTHSVFSISLERAPESVIILTHSFRIPYYFHSHTKNKVALIISGFKSILTLHSSSRLMSISCIY